MKTFVNRFGAIVLLAACAMPLGAVTITNATVDLAAVPPTVTFISSNDDFGDLQGSVFQLVGGDPVALDIISWTTQAVEAALNSTEAGDYLMAVVPIGQSAAFFTVTIAASAATVPDPPCFDNDNRYVDCGNGTVTDTATGLIWLQNGNCFGNLFYAEANASAAALEHGECGLADQSRPGDWRLATAQEWDRTMETPRGYGCDPCLTNDSGGNCLSVGPTSFFNVQSGSYWTSESEGGDGTNASVAPLDNCGAGAADKIFPSIFVWPVRGGQ